VNLKGYVFKVTIPTKTGEQTYVHQYFGTSRKAAEGKVRERFGKKVKVAFVKEVT
jgi:hypothetical protein